MKKTAAMVLTLLLLVGASAGLLVYYSTRPGGARASRGTLRNFSSPEQFIAAFLNGQKSRYAGGGDVMLMREAATPSAAVAQGAGAPEHSTTNIQVEGVDEADIVKSDGACVYAVSGRSVFIVAAWPAETARVLARLDFGEEAAVSELLINGDRLVVTGTSGYRPGSGEEGEEARPRGEVTFIEIYDVSDRDNPALARRVEYEGSYSTSRMIGSDVHVVLSTYPFYAFDRKDIEPADVIPGFRDRREGARDPGFEPACDYSRVQVVDPEGFTSFLSVVSFSLDGTDPTLDRRVVAGYSDCVYASRDSLYIASARYPYHVFGPGPVFPGGDARTMVHKFAFDGPTTRYLNSAEVPGTILNQFSMDESDGHFRIATTRGFVSREGSDSANNVYVLDPQMKITGRLEGLARGEKIYSVRFMGPRAYMVTFKKVDPLFVLDLADPRNPRVLGELKIPGYSDYLHPYDENHVIGVGKNAVEAAPEEGGAFAWYQGMKIALFDVTDVADPREMHKVEIGDRGTDSYALHDHRAFLFDRDRSLLVLPVLLSELTPERKASPDRRDYDYGTFTFQGAYVYDVTLEGGFNLKGRVTHASVGEPLERGYGYYAAPDSVRRALYIGDGLYTVSGARLKINSLGDLAEIKTVELE